MSRNKIIMLIIVLLNLLAGCNKDNNLSLKKLQSVPEQPDWLIPIETELDESFLAEYESARPGYDNIKIALRKYHFLLNKYPQSDRVPFWLYMTAKLFLELDNDHLAYYTGQKLLDLPDDTLCIKDWFMAPDLSAYKQDIDSLMLRILARNNLAEEFNARVKKYSPVNSKQYFELAKSYMLLGDKTNSIAMLEKTLMDKNIQWKPNKSSFTAGACAMTYSMGEFDKLKEYSQWIIDAGSDPADFIPEEDPWGYYKNQWDSCYEIVTVFLKLSESGKPTELTGLKNGTYTKSVRGFIDLIDVTVRIDNGKATEITVTNYKDDRPFSACTVMPSRIINNKKITADTVTSATVTSSAIIAAVSQAITDAQE